jgi:hypothetical protein
MVGMPRKPQAPRPRWHCLRCGHDWTGNSLAHPPARCLRCRSFYWDREPEKPSLARKPSDPPNPKWDVKTPRIARTPKFAEVIRKEAIWAKEQVRKEFAVSPRGLPPPPQLADFATNGDRKIMNVQFPAGPMPPPRFDEPTPESFIHATADDPVTFANVGMPSDLAITDADPRTEELVDNVVAALVPSEPPEPSAELAAEADVRESEYIEEVTEP